MGNEMIETESDAGKETHTNIIIWKADRQLSRGQTTGCRNRHQEWPCTERASEVVKAIALALERDIRTPSFRLFLPDGIYSSVSQ